MATLILHGNEKLEDFKVTDQDCVLNALDVSDIDVIIHREGHNTTVIKSPIVKLD